MKIISQIQYINQTQTKNEILEEVELALKAGVDWVQLRMKNPDLEEVKIAEEVKKLCADHQAAFIINDKVDLAKLVDADGVHLGLTDMPIPQAREVLGTDKIIGATANTLADVKNGELFGADYIGLGPYRFTSTKKNLSPVLGLEGYQQILPKKEPYGWEYLSVNVPVVAIGGIEVEDIKLLKNETAIHGVALSGLIYKSTHKTELINELKHILK